MLIGISGYAQTGKDSAAKLLEEFGFERRAFADTLREALVALNPSVAYRGEYFPLADLWKWHGYEKLREHAPEVRGLLQRLGTEVGRNMLGQDVWVNAALASCEPGRHYVFTDVRFPNEADALQELGGYIIRVERPGFGPANAHSSEVSMDGYPWDYLIVNDGDFSAYRSRLAKIVESLRVG